MRESTVSHVWYVSYGSNMHADRFACYLRGGSPAGVAHVYPGCRDGSPPRAVRAVEAPGGIYFATRSPVWGGGRAFFDTGLPGTAAMRGYLITTSQFADVVEQEMYREPGPEIDLTTVLAEGREQRGPGRYDTLLRLADVAGHPALTFTAPWTSGEVEHTAPSAPYLTVLRDGLREAHSWSPAQAAAYLAARTPFWTASAIERL